MGDSSDSSSRSPDHDPTRFVLTSTKEFFSELLGGALEEKRVSAPPLVVRYLLSLLEHYIWAENLHVKTDGATPHAYRTLAEMYLYAVGAEPVIRRDLLKKLGDRSLFMSGFFPESLNRKTVDVEYYVDMGSRAYRNLAAEEPEDLKAKIYSDMSDRFLELVGVFSHMGVKTFQRLSDDQLLLHRIRASLQ